MKRQFLFRAGVLATLALSGLPAIGQPAPGSVAAPAQPTAQQTIQQEVNAALALMNQQKFPEAEAAFKALAEKAPQNGQVWFGLGYCLHVRGELDGALEAHLKASKFAMGQPRFLAMYNAGCAYALKGDKDNSFAMLRKAALAGMRNKQQISGDSDLKSLQDDARWNEYLTFIDDIVKAPPEKALLFWKGEWDVYAQNGQSGVNVLEERMNGAAIHEKWTNMQGGVGESWNYYDQAEGTWTQIWVEPTGRYMHFVGKPKEGGIFFEGEVHGASGVEGRVTMFVRPIGDGMIRQTGGQYDDAGVHSLRYDLVYVAKGKAFDPASFAW